MGRPPDSQAAPLPTNLPFRIVSKTIGSGAYASIRKAVPLKQAFPVIAVKFINKEHAFRTGRLKPVQIDLELGLHRTVSGHTNVIRYLNTGEDDHWKWLAMELAEGGDLFDKIEADEGVDENIAHLYFSQLVSAVMWCHSKGVAHRDIKPENILLSKEGDLKLADFGLATQFQLKTGQRKLSSMVCGSPPYIAPEILAVGHANSRRKPDQEKMVYDPEKVDIWSCAIVLFVLCAGNTPWDTPDTKESWEFHEYVKTNGEPNDELWQKIPVNSMSLLRGMLTLEPAQRWSFDTVRTHPWFQRHNPHMSNGKTVDGGIGVATNLLQSLRIDFDKKITASQVTDAMDVDQETQLDAAIGRMSTDWEERPPPSMPGASLLDRLAEDPSMSQFSATPSVPLSLTQVARGFSDILSTHSMTRFLSTMPLVDLLTALSLAFQQLNVPMTPTSKIVLPLILPIKTLDVRKQELQGNIRISAYQDGLLDVSFNKAKGDPVGWRRLFKDIATICKDAVVRPP